MDNLDLSGYEDIVSSNFYSDDFDYMSADVNGNGAEYKQLEDGFFDSPSDFDQDFI